MKVTINKPLTLSRIEHTLRLESTLVFLAGIAAFVAWSLYAGRDLNWDFLNYHLYLGQTANGARLHQDFFPASIQSYLSPYAFWPLAAMISAGWPAPLISAALGALHSSVVVATWYLSRQLFPDLTRQAAWARAIATVVGVASPLVLTQVGNSFIDLPSAIPIVVGLALLLRAVRIDERRFTFIAVAGILFGMAAGLKLTNAIFGIAAGISIFAVCCLRRDLKFKVVVGLIVGQMAGFLLVYGYWGTRLWIEFGNPVFPGLNTIFQSPDFPLVEIRHQRFLPTGVYDWLALPVRMLNPILNVYTEVRAPDARYLALFCFLPVVVWRKRQRLAQSAVAPLIIFFLASWLLWEITSGNGRYMMPLAIIVGPLLVWCIAVCFERRNLALLVATIAFACVQVASIGLGTTFRWTADNSWQREWISATLPENLRDRPYTFVSFSPQSTSWMVEMVHPESRLINAVGQYAIPVNGRGWSRLQRIFDESSAIIAVFPFGLIDPITGIPEPIRPTRMAVIAETYGLQVDLESCQRGKLNAKIEQGMLLHASNLTGIVGLFFCRATYAAAAAKMPVLDAKVEVAFNRIEDACPQWFSPPRTQTFCIADGCMRTYFNSDAMLQIGSNGAVTYRSSAVTFRNDNTPGLLALGKIGKAGTGLNLAFCGDRDLGSNP